MNSMAEVLNEVENTKSYTEEYNSGEVDKFLQEMQKMKKLNHKKIEEIEKIEKKQMNLVLSHPSFKEDPLSTIQTHLNNCFEKGIFTSEKPLPNNENSNKKKNRNKKKNKNKMNF